MFLLTAGDVCLSEIGKTTRPVNPNLKYSTIESYQRTTGENAVLLDSDNVCLYAPKRLEKQAQIIFKYLVEAYEKLYRITEVHTQYKIIVYHFPAGHPDAKGGTSNCTIWYDYENLDLEKQDEWKKYKVPHVSGYIEEMAHNFTAATYATFGWEMIGWTLATKVTAEIAGNPVFRKALEETRKDQRETFARYCKDGYQFPRNLPANKCDRIHAWILYNCEKDYGPGFWPDFFTEIRKQYEPLSAAVKIGNGDMIRNRRYQITLDCFERLAGLNFKERLEKLQISLEVDIESLHPEEKNWDRRFMPPANAVGEVPAVIDPNTLPGLHLAAYNGQSDSARRLIENGTAVNSTDSNGRTALHIAAMKGHSRLAGMLLEVGADAGIRDKQGYTPVRLAEIGGHGETAGILKNSPAKH